KKSKANEVPIQKTNPGGPPRTPPFPVFFVCVCAYSRSLCRAVYSCCVPPAARRGGMHPAPASSAPGGTLSRPMPSYPQQPGQLSGYTLLQHRTASSGEEGSFAGTGSSLLAVHASTAAAAPLSSSAFGPAGVSKPAAYSAANLMHTQQRYPNVDYGYA